MFTRHLFAAAALMAAACGAHADVISTSTVSGLGSGMNIVDGSSALSGDLASMLATSTSNAQLYLVRGVEGLYMLASRTTFVLPDSASTTATLPALAAATEVAAGASAIQTPAPTPIAEAQINIDVPVAAIPVTADAGAILPVLDANEVPEPASLALIFAGLLGVVGVTRARKQG
ncbi:MAG: PEP-CTERM sorting domain-containing protein [Pseudomonadota bacterium]|nr:PEP-CTERM sorting domain-containing protein [Pseudomonadota bacterium]